MKLKIGDNCPNIVINTIKGKELAVPNTNSNFLHLQFRRFAGCPVCNFHLHNLAKRNQDIRAAGISEIIFFHSSKEEMLKYQDHIPFDCVADPKKQFYKMFGVETSKRSILHPSVLLNGTLNVLRTRKLYNKAENGIFGLPADFMIDSNGKIIRAHYASHAGDNWSYEDLIEIINSEDLQR